MLEKKKVKIYLPVCLLAFLLIGLPAGYVYMVEYDMRNARCITLIHNQSDYTLPLQLNPFIPYKAVISQIGHGEYVDKLPFKLKTHIFLNDKVIHTYAAEHLKLGYRQDGDTKRGVASLDTMPRIPLAAICTPLNLQICIEWEKNEHIGKAFKFEIITSLSEI